MNNKDLLYKKLNALRLEVDSSIVDDIKSTVDALFQEQNLQQTDVSGSLPPSEAEIDAAAETAAEEEDWYNFPKDMFKAGVKWVLGGNDR